MPTLPHVKDADVDGKRVFLRCDFNVPLDSECNITDETRILASLRTIHFLLDRGARVYVTSHLGRPKGKVVPELSLKPVATRLADLVGGEVPLIEDYIDGDYPETLDRISPGEIAVLENTRFFPGETKNDPELGAAYARLADIYVNDAFGTSHRAHASVVSVAERLPHYAGFLLVEEIEHIDGLLQEDVARPYVVCLGGAKVKNKLPILEFLAPRVDTILIGGACAFTFLKAQWREVGTSMVEEDMIEAARTVLTNQANMGYRIELPRDLLVAPNSDPDTEARLVDIEDFPHDCAGFDIGSKTQGAWDPLLRRAGTVLWNGPMGLFEDWRYNGGTRAIAKAIALGQGFSVAGGGETMSAINHFGLGWGFSHMSTGGGASLEYMSGKVLPGVAVLLDPQPVVV
ncbi:phosphoglycerate kinase [bacterium]|nr:phosphoglycerate kinase [bacterium]